jgi:hypothetical protein
VGNVMIPEEIATMAGGPEPIGPPGEPPMAPPAPGGGGLPPELAGGGGGLPPELAGLFGGGGPGGEPAPEGPPEGGQRGEVEILREMLDLGMEYAQVASDDIEKAKMMKAAAIIQDLLATNQQQQEAASGTTPALKGMGKALAGP